MLALKDVEQMQSHPLIPAIALPLEHNAAAVEEESLAVHVPLQDLIQMSFQKKSQQPV